MPASTLRGPIHAGGFLVGDLLGKLEEEFHKMKTEKYKCWLGGYFCFADGGTGGQPFWTAKVGNPPWPKAEKHLALCQEAARRLAKHPEHTSSRESRDPDLDRLGGAIRADAHMMNGDPYGIILSFSGFSSSGPTEEADEELMQALALRMEMPLSTVASDTAST